MASYNIPMTHLEAGELVSLNLYRGYEIDLDRLQGPMMICHPTIDPCISGDYLESFNVLLYMSSLNVNASSSSRSSSNINAHNSFSSLLEINQELPIMFIGHVSRVKILSIKTFDHDDETKRHLVNLSLSWIKGFPTLGIETYQNYPYLSRVTLLNRSFTMLGYGIVVKKLNSNQHQQPYAKLRHCQRFHDVIVVSHLTLMC
ncbi:hypothetical protein C9374_009359 [Naegleria lovaniensis]|uniref:Uncharacterized protein n=1 Tax=Naegleria lovaniensis TaxID=51637 RepID=A0AA88GFA8_NAELO|nr:uncharacterized protein C9374_009359 [Naegleria lovaniensis]KAG2377448.1 hypothetical protein C9374_009359 [Naegleria lovaniensis]